MTWISSLAQAGAADPIQALVPEIATAGTHLAVPSTVRRAEATPARSVPEASTGFARARREGPGPSRSRQPFAVMLH